MSTHKNYTQNQMDAYRHLQQLFSYL